LRNSSSSVSPRATKSQSTPASLQLMTFGIGHLLFPFLIPGITVRPSPTLRGFPISAVSRNHETAKGGRPGALTNPPLVNGFPLRIYFDKHPLKREHVSIGRTTSGGGVG
jgi:hypothetical protein